MTKLFRSLKASRQGASSAEYALLCGILVIGIVAGGSALGTNINTSLDGSAGRIGTSK